MLTLETLTQDVLDLAWKIWFKHSGTSLPPIPAPTVADVRRSFEVMGIDETALGMEGYSHGKLWIMGDHRNSRPDHNPIYFSAEQFGMDQSPEVKERNREIARVIEEAWEEAGLPTRSE